MEELTTTSYNSGFNAGYAEAMAELLVVANEYDYWELVDWVNDKMEEFVDKCHKA